MLTSWLVDLDDKSIATAGCDTLIDLIDGIENLGRDNYSPRPCLSYFNLKPRRVWLYPVHRQGAPFRGSSYGRLVQDLLRTLLLGILIEREKCFDDLPL